MAHDVFISYSSIDKPVAEAICANLESAVIRCWNAPRDIGPGEDWPPMITKAISQSRIIVLIFSVNSNPSDQVSRELSPAADYKLVIIPFKIDNTVLEPGKQYFLSRTHWLDAMNPPTQEQINSLTEGIRYKITMEGRYFCIPFSNDVQQCFFPDSWRINQGHGIRSGVANLATPPLSA